MDGPVTTHASLLVRLRDGADSAAWREFDDRYGGLIRGFAWRRGLQSADADDVAQDVMLALQNAMPGFRYDPSKGKFRSYLKTATLRAVFKKNRQKRGEVALGPVGEAECAEAADAGINAEWEEEWRQYHLRQAMRSINVEFSASSVKAFRRYAVEGQDARETAESLGLSVDQVYLAKSRITKRLTELIEVQVRDEG